MLPKLWTCQDLGKHVSATGGRAYVSHKPGCHSESNGYKRLDRASNEEPHLAVSECDSPGKNTTNMSNMLLCKWSTPLSQAVFHSTDLEPHNRASVRVETPNIHEMTACQYHAYLRPWKLAWLVRVARA